MLGFRPFSPHLQSSTFNSVVYAGGNVALEHRGFRVNVDVAADEQGVQWVCRSSIERIDGNREAGAPAGDELTIPRLKIDPLMAIHTLEHRAVAQIDEFCDRAHAAA
jgi:hypothetical protein